jgi:hypothetical protein
MRIISISLYVCPRTETNVSSSVFSQLNTGRIMLIRPDGSLMVCASPDLALTAKKSANSKTVQQIY